jgi:RsiW-degrading membrane proteinase PrsW (M82 family)
MGRQLSGYREKFLPCPKVTQKPLFKMGLFALAIAPGIAICIFIYRKDRYNKEPLGMLILAFILGVLSIIPALLVQVGSGIRIDSLSSDHLLPAAFFSYGIVAASEEGSKFLALRLFLYRSRHFDDPFDGITYAVMVGMGFATIENIGYVYQHGMATAILRMFLSVPGHATFAVLMGYFTGLAKFKTSNKAYYFFMALFLPILFHGSFDFFLFIGKDGYIALGAIASFIISLIMSFKAIRRKQEMSRVYQEEKNNYDV